MGSHLSIMIKTSHVLLFFILAVIISTKTISRNMSEADFDSPLYYHQMGHHKTPTPPSPQELSSSSPPATTEDDSSFSIFGEILQMMQSFAQDFGERSGFTEWWWGEK